MDKPRYLLDLSDGAKQDIRDILRHGYKHHGESTALNYNKLINDAFSLLEQDPFRASSTDRSDIAQDVRSYRLDVANISIKSPIKKPRHVIFYFTVDQDNKLVIARVLHDARDHTRTMAQICDDVMKRAVEPENDDPTREQERER